MDETPLVVPETPKTAADVTATPTVAPSVETRSTEFSKLSIQGAGLKFERDIPDAVVLRILKLVLTGGGQIDDSPVAEDRADNGTGARREALAEFYRRVAPKKNPQRLTVIAAYLQSRLGRSSFTHDDLRSQFRHVGESAPANLPRDFRDAIAEGWIAEDHDAPGQFYVTQSGLDAVDAAFSAEDAKRGGRSRRRRRTSKGATAEKGAAAEERTDDGE